MKTIHETPTDGMLGADFKLFVQSNKPTTPIGVKHMFAEHAWSTFLPLNVFEWF